MKKILFTMLCIGAFTVNASPFQGTSSGIFVNPIGSSKMTTTGVGTNQFTWGTATGVNGHDRASSFGYAGELFNVDENDAFVLGSLTYFNGTIKSSTGAKTVDLDVSLDFSAPAGISGQFTFDLELINTNNSGDAISSADIVNIDNNAIYNYFSYGGIDYTLEFLGFGTLTGEGFSVNKSFSVIENESAQIDLIGRITSSPTAVPVPAAVWLFGSGIIGLIRIKKNIK